VDCVPSGDGRDYARGIVPEDGILDNVVDALPSAGIERVGHPASLPHFTPDDGCTDLCRAQSEVATFSGPDVGMV
jgi:hypothetical protein